ncbi:MAG: hypothetical protein GY861_22555 [bacterium]|nr:hypothetical protein [bacterium]
MLKRIIKMLDRKLQEQVDGEQTTMSIGISVANVSPMPVGRCFQFSSGHVCVNMWYEGLLEFIRRNGDLPELEITEVSEGDRLYCVITDPTVPRAYLNRGICVIERDAISTKTFNKLVDINDEVFYGYHDEEKDDYAYPFINEDLLNGSESVFGFCGWLLSLRDDVDLNSINSADMMTYIIKFCQANELIPPRNGWENNLRFPPSEGGFLGMDYYMQKSSTEYIQ